MDVNDFPLCLGISLPSSISQFLLQASRQFLPLVFHMATMCISQMFFEKGVCILFQKGIFAYWTPTWSWSDGMEPKNLHVCRILR
jgi:hypothetical protein